VLDRAAELSECLARDHCVNFSNVKLRDQTRNFGTDLVLARPLLLADLGVGSLTFYDVPLPRYCLQQCKLSITASEL